jgi:hypothetical protein
VVTFRVVVQWLKGFFNGLGFKVLELRFLVLILRFRVLVVTFRVIV